MVTRGHGAKPADNQNKKIALLIAVIALFLAFSETLGKSAQDGLAELQRRGVQSLGLLPGADDPPDDASASDGAAQVRAHEDRWRIQRCDQGKQ